MDLPVYIKTRFKDFYRDMFDQQVKKADMRAVFTEYAWDMNWCDPCAADPLSVEELRSLGVFWLKNDGPVFVPGQGRRPAPPVGDARNVFVTRMHVRYDAQRFPEDLVLQETADRNNFQARYVLRHHGRARRHPVPRPTTTAAKSCGAGRTKRANWPSSPAGTSPASARK